MVVISTPTASETLVTQDRVAWPLRWTVHDPHCETPQPNLVPLRSRTSRSTQSSGMSGGTSTVTDFPFTLSVSGMAEALRLGGVRGALAGWGGSLARAGWQPDDSILH